MTSSVKTQLTDDLFDTPALKNIGLVVNTAWSLLICTTCEMAILPSNVFSHMKSKHPGLKIEPDVRHNVSEDLQLFDLPDNFPDVPTSIVPRIQGLPILDSVYCDRCLVTKQHADNIVRHYRLDHSGESKPAIWAEGPAQRFTKGVGIHQQVFRVSASEAVTDPGTFDISHIFSKMEETQKALTPDLDVRNVSPWLRITKWHEMIEGHEVAHLISLVSFPTVQEFPILQQVVLSMLMDASDLIEKTTPLVLEILNSPDPAKHGVSNNPFHKHQEHSPTMVKYSYPIVGLLAMLLRPKTSYPIDLPDKISEAVSRLSIALAAGDIIRSHQYSYQVLKLLWTTEWTQTKGGHSSDPTIQYFSLSTIRDNGNFLEPKLITNTLARLVYCMRLVFLRSIHEAGGNLEAVCRELQYWFVEKNETTFNSLRSLQHLASNFAYTTLGHPQVVWLDRVTYLTLLFKGDPVDFNKFPAMLDSQEQEMMRVWEHDVLLGKRLAVKSTLIHDDLSETKPGYSFVSDRRNKIFQSKTILLDAIMTDPVLRKRFVVFESGKHIRFNVPALRAWLATYSHFQLLQLVRSNLTTGSPSRGTELTAMLRQNTPTNPMRNLVFFGKFATILCTYSKTSAATRSDKCIPHALDGFSSDLMVQDMAIARPFAEFAAHLAYHDPGPIVYLYRNHLFVNQDRLFTTEDLKAGIERLTVSQLGVKLGVNGFRHVSTAFRRKICNAMEEVIEEDDNDTVQAQQSGHSRRTENRIYGLSPDAMAGAPEDLLPLFLDASTDWQVACKVVPGGLGLTYSEARATNFDSLVQAGRIVPRSSSNLQLLLNELQTNVNQLLSRLESRLDEINDRLADPLSKDVTLGLFTRLSAFEKRMDSLLLRVEARMDVVEGLLDNAHAELPSAQLPKRSQTLSDVSSESTLREAPIPSDNDSNDPGSPESLLPVVPIEDRALAVLRRLLKNPCAKWTCDAQREGVLAMLELKQDVLAIMATGSGKTMLAVIPPLMEPDYTTVIILPFRSLMMDMKRRLDDMEVPYEVFTGGALKGQANIVLVSADMSRFDTWKEHINKLNVQRPVVRQVYDEVHEPLIARDYRDAMRGVYRIRCTLRAQLVGLSGTVNHIQEQALFDMFEFGYDTLVFRTGTNRPELKFVWKTERVSELNVSQLVKDLLDQHPAASPSDRALVFVLKLQIGKDISAALGLDFYHGGLTDNERQAIHDAWISGTNYAMICTSAFGAGNDYPHTRLVIHAGSPYEMIGYIQEVGRAGRDKQPATCILISTPVWIPDLKGERDYGGKVAMHKAITQNPGSCIRFRLTNHVDPKGTYCLDDPDNQLCSFCERLQAKVSATKRGPTDAFQKQTENAKRRRVQEELSELDYANNFKQQLDRFSDSCTFCMLHGIDSPPHDIFQQCHTMQSGPGASQFKKFRQGLRYDASQGLTRICYFCHVPQADGDRLHPQFSSRYACAYPDLIAPLVFGIFTDPGLRQVMEAFFEKTFESTDSFVAWLNSRPVNGHKSNLSAVFLWYANVHAQF